MNMNSSFFLEVCLDVTFTDPSNQNLQTSMESAAQSSIFLLKKRL